MTEKKVQTLFIIQHFKKHLPTGFVSKKYIVAPRSFLNMWLWRFCDADTAIKRKATALAYARMNVPTTRPAYIEMFCFLNLSRSSAWIVELLGRISASKARLSSSSALKFDMYQHRVKREDLLLIKYCDLPQEANFEDNHIVTSTGH